MEEFYFCIRLTEAEHDAVSVDMKNVCNDYGCQLMYYRTLKDGHVPMVREVKVSGRRVPLNRVKAYVVHNLMDYVCPNPHRTE